MSLAVSMKIGAAVRYNKEAALRLGWYGKVPDEAVKEWPGLGEDPVLGTRWEREYFARSVVDLQRAEGFGGVACDGKLGKKTAAAIMSRYDETLTSVVINNGVPLSIGQAQVINWKEDGGLSLHEDGGFRKIDGRKPRIIVPHWGGLNAIHCRNVLASADLSSHFGVDPTGVYQWLDTGFSAYHAGFVNNYAIGIDICQHPLPEHLDRYSSNPGSDVKVIDNPTNRGEKRVLSLDSRVAAQVRDLVFGLCDLFDIEPTTHRGSDGSVSHEVVRKDVLNHHVTTGVYGHHHISATKWDIAPWWQQIFAGTPLGD